MHSFILMIAAVHKIKLNLVRTRKRERPSSKYQGHSTRFIDGSKSEDDMGRGSKGLQPATGTDNTGCHETSL